MSELFHYEVVRRTLYGSDVPIASTLGRPPALSDPIAFEQLRLLLMTIGTQHPDWKLGWRFLVIQH